MAVGRSAGSLSARVRLAGWQGRNSAPAGSYSQYVSGVQQDIACQFFWLQAQKDLHVRYRYWKFVHSCHLLPKIAAEDFSCGFYVAANSRRGTFSSVVCA
jgi:hypothetical protein